MSQQAWSRDFNNAKYKIHLTGYTFRILYLLFYYLQLVNYTA